MRNSKQPRLSFAVFAGITFAIGLAAMSERTPEVFVPYLTYIGTPLIIGLFLIFICQTYRPRHTTVAALLTLLAVIVGLYFVVIA